MVSLRKVRPAARMSRVRFGHCISCDQPIRPPYLSLKVMRAEGDGNTIAEWEEVDVCDPCAGTLTVDRLHQIVSEGT